MEYTKGEWKQQAASDDNTAKNDNRIVLCGIYTIASVYGRARKEETEANAQLISSAPDMYEALRDIGLSIAVNYDDNNKPFFLIDAEYLERIRAIIAKAEGKLPLCYR